MDIAWASHSIQSKNNCPLSIKLVVKVKNTIIFSILSSYPEVQLISSPYFFRDIEAIGSFFNNLQLLQELHGSHHSFN